MSGKLSARLEAFLSALPHAHEEEFVNAPGLGTFRARYIRSGLDKGVLTIHSTGMGLCIVQPKTHGVCRECAESKLRSLCEHCRCEMCGWFRVAEERNSPRVSQERVRDLALRLRAFRFTGPPPPRQPDLTADLWSDT